MKRVIVLSALSMSLLSGCMPVNTQDLYGYHYEEPKFYKPTPQEEATADYGQYPDNYETIIKEYTVRKLKDPDSAKFRFDIKPRKDHTTVMTRQEIQYCWTVSFYVNAKNSYGGYTGEKLGIAKIRDGKIIWYFLGD